ncbi:ABC transporter permease [Dietzia sp.]|uniref:ABC transporter permease n=1 Tax=Dietzia sp. TaxID=1871616 RepID=UPI002FD964A1
MNSYLLRRVPSALGVIIVGSIVVFALLHLIPGDPAQVIAGGDAGPDAVAALREKLGLDAPLWQQYFSWIGSVLTFRLGDSLVLGGTISSLVLEAAGNTAALAGTALLFAVLLGALFGIIPELIDRRWARSVATAYNTLAIAIPNFVVGTVLIVAFGVLLIVLPAGGIPRDGLAADPGITFQFLLLPALCLALPIGAALSRFLNEAITGELSQPYVTTALALGIRRRRIITTQILPNALPPALTVLGIQIGQLFGGAVIVEALFAWPGLGYLAQQAIAGRDYPVVQVILVLSVAVFVLVQLATDIAHASLDPRVRTKEAAA